MGKNLVYFNGDSFIAGDEITDMYLDDFPGWNTYSECLDEHGVFRNKTEQQQWSLNTWDISTVNGYMKSHTSAMSHPLRKMHSVSGELDARLNCDVMNNAVPGASMERIALTTVADLTEQSQKYDKIIAFIGTTWPARRMLPALRDIDYVSAISEAHDSIIFASNPTGDYGPIIEFYLKHGNDYHDIVNTMINAITIKNFCDVKNIELYWLTTLLDIEYYKNNIKENFLDSEFMSKCQPGWRSSDKRWKAMSEYKELDSLYDHLDYHNQEIIHLDTLAREIDTDVLCPAGHFAPALHKGLAEKLIPTITASGEIMQTDLNYDKINEKIKDYKQVLEHFREKFYEQNRT